MLQKIGMVTAKKLSSSANTAKREFVALVPAANSRLVNAKLLGDVFLCEIGAF